MQRKINPLLLLFSLVGGESDLPLGNFCFASGDRASRHRGYRDLFRNFGLVHRIGLLHRRTDLPSFEWELMETAIYRHIMEAADSIHFGGTVPVRYAV